jgi:hypothetical protein
LIQQIKFDGIHWGKSNISGHWYVRLLEESLLKNKHNISTIEYEQSVHHLPKIIYVYWNDAFNQFELYREPVPDRTINFHEYFKLHNGQFKRLTESAESLSQSAINQVKLNDQMNADYANEKLESLDDHPVQRSSNNLENTRSMISIERQRIKVGQYKFQQTYSNHKSNISPNQSMNHCNIKADTLINIIINAYSNLYNSDVPQQILTDFENQLKNEGYILINNVNVEYDSRIHISQGTVRTNDLNFHKCVAEVIKVGLMNIDGEVIRSAVVTHFISK